MKLADKWRLLPMRIDDAFMSMAIEETLLRLNAEGASPNTIRFWRFLPSAVSLGCFQSVDREVDPSVARKYNVDIVRRITGGGAVFHDHDGELTYSVVCRLEQMPDDIIDSYKFICGGIIKGLEKLGLKADFKPVNDIQVNGKKVSGCAQTRQWGSVLQHGTILISPDVRKMFELLRVTPEKISDKFISSVFERVTTLEREMKIKPSFKEVRETMAESFEDVLSVEFTESGMTEQETKLALDIRQKYASHDWTMKR